jgi:hypothetical protein
LHEFPTKEQHGEDHYSEEQRAENLRAVEFHAQLENI